MLKSLNLLNFRNYSKLKLDFSSQPTILVGNNAAGKTNVLEAVYFLSTTKSPRVSQDHELIKEGSSVCRAEGEVEEDGQSNNLVVTMTDGSEGGYSKRVLVNGVARRVVDFVGNLPAVFFLPSDIEMTTGSPSLRRWHLDVGLAQIDKDYKRNLTWYEQFLTSRNRVLKRIREGAGRADELEYWTRELVEKGRQISGKRQEFFEFINKLEKPLGNYFFEYHPSEISLEKLQAINGREVAAAATLIGPHRDDFVIEALSPERNRASISLSTTLSDNRMGRRVEGQGLWRNLAHFGSRGEQREATVAFKLAQLEYMAKVLGVRPILLLDDVFSELDSIHRDHIVSVASKQQTIISTIELSEVPDSLLKKARILKVEDGKVSLLLL